MGKQEAAAARREWLVGCMRFVLGLSPERPERIINFVDGRSRKVDLLQMREYKAVINANYTKMECCEFFCNLLDSERAKLLELFPDMITMLPSDCKDLKIERPQPVATRSNRFNGKLVEYSVYKIIDVLNAYDQSQVHSPQEAGEK